MIAFKQRIHRLNKESKKEKLDGSLLIIMGVNTMENTMVKYRKENLMGLEYGKEMGGKIGRLKESGKTEEFMEKII